MADMTTGYHTIIDHYEQCLARHGDSHRGVDWPNAADAATRYRVMLELLRPQPLEAPAPLELLDFGCGAGHLLEHIHEHGPHDLRYRGIDVSQPFIDLAKRKFPGIEFHCFDVLADDALLPSADFIVLNGVLTEKRGLPFEEMFDYMARLLPRVFAAARRGMAFNVMSHHVDWQRDDLFHVPFDQMAAFVRTNLSRHFLFRADYGLYEYTTYVYREPR